MSKKRTILVIDDSDDWLATVESILEPYYDLTLCIDPAVALELLKSREFALVIIDKQLPGTSGVEVLKKMRALHPGLPTIMLTGFADVDSAVESIKTGASDYISKSTDDLPKTLRSRVAAILESTADPGITAIQNLIAKGESAELEFKASARWDMRSHRINKELEKVVVKTTAAFLNSYQGGILLLGVDDNGVIVGLKGDFSTLGKKPNRDGYEHLLMTLFTDAFGADCSPFISLSFHHIDGEEICQISIKPAPKAMFVQDDRAENLFIRSGNSTRLLSTREAIEYCSNRFPRNQ